MNDSISSGSEAETILSLVDKKDYFNTMIKSMITSKPLKQRPTWTDLRIRCVNNEKVTSVTVQKLLLISQSPFLQELLNMGTDNTELILADVDDLDVRNLLSVISTGSCLCQVDHVSILVKLSDSLGFHSLASSLKSTRADGMKIDSVEERTKTNTFTANAKCPAQNTRNGVFVEPRQMQEKSIEMNRCSDFISKDQNLTNVNSLFNTVERKDNIIDGRVQNGSMLKTNLNCQDETYFKKCHVCKKLIASSGVYMIYCHIARIHFKEHLLNDFRTKDSRCSVCGIAEKNIVGGECQFVLHLGAKHKLVETYMERDIVKTYRSKSSRSKIRTIRPATNIHSEGDRQLSRVGSVKENIDGSDMTSIGLD